MTAPPYRRARIFRFLPPSRSVRPSGRSSSLRRTKCPLFLSSFNDLVVRVPSLATLKSDLATPDRSTGVRVRAH